MSNYRTPEWRWAAPGNRHPLGRRTAAGMLGLLSLVAMLPADGIAATAGTDLEMEISALKQRLQRLEAAYRQYRASTSNMPDPTDRELGMLRGKGTAASDPAEPAAATAREDASGTTGVAQGSIKKRPDASKSAQAVYQEQHALFERKFTFEPGLSYAYSDRNQISLNGFLALDAIFLGSVSVDKVKSHNFTLDLTGRYGLTPNTQVDLNIPYLYRYTVYESAGQGSVGTQYSSGSAYLSPRFRVGDINGGVYYRLLTESESRPDLVWNFRVKAPTGSSPYGIKTIRPQSTNSSLNYPEELPSGTGTWAVSTGLSLVKTTDPAILFANLGYFYNLSRHFDDISSNPGQVVPGSIKLGDSVQYGLGMAFALNDSTSMSFGYTQRVTFLSRTKIDGQSWQDVSGSEGNAAILNIGATHAISNRGSLVFGIGIGLTNDAPDIQVSAKLPYQF